MKDQSEHTIDESILLRMLSGEITDAEEKRFNNWITEAPENKEYFNDLKRIWSHTGTLSDFQSINAPADWYTVKQKMGFADNNLSEPKRAKSTRITLFSIAAAVIVLLGVGILTKKYVLPAPEMLIVATGEMMEEVTLPDGSIVFLNKHSELSYPEKFSRKQRQVSIRGEAFFEVTKDPDKAFKLNIGNEAVVEVLGTSFNVNSDFEKGTVLVRVVSGRVAFFQKDTESDRVILVDNEAAELKAGIITGDIPEDKNFMSWKTGILRFEEDNLENVIPELENYYNIEFILDVPGDEEILFTSIIDNQDLENVLEEMHIVLDLNYEFSEGKVVISLSEENQ